MPADISGSGRPLKVLASGLHQLGERCETLTGELSAAAASSVVAASRWQASARAVNIAAAAARKDLTAIVQRVGARGTDYRTAGSAYTENDEDSGEEFRGLVS